MSHEKRPLAELMQENGEKGITQKRKANTSCYICG